MNLLILVSGALAGFLSSFLGIGGGIIMVPALNRLLNYSMHIAVGTTLLAMIFLTLSGAFNHFRRKEFDFQAWLGLAGGGTVGALTGAQLAVSFSSALLKYIFGTVVILIGIRMILNVQIPDEKREFSDAWKYVVLPAVAFLIGIISALSGLGGGIFYVPLLIFMGLSHETAVGTSLGVIVLTAISGSAGYVYHGNASFEAAILLTISALLFTFIGAWTTAKVNKAKFSRIFGLVAILIGINTVFPII